MAFPFVLSLAVCTRFTASGPWAADSTAAAFLTLAHGNTAIAKIKGPAIFLAADAEKVAHFAAWIKDNENAAKLAKVDFATHLVVAVFAGVRPSSGYGITVKRVESSNGSVTVTTALSGPISGQAVTDVISFPYHVIAVPYTAVASKPKTVWRVITDAGVEVVRTMTP
jgi:hypothetical protein